MNDSQAQFLERARETASTYGWSVEPRDGGFDLINRNGKAVGNVEFRKGTRYNVYLGTDKEFKVYSGGFGLGMRDGIDRVISQVWYGVKIK